MVMSSDYKIQKKRFFLQVGSKNVSSKAWHSMHIGASTEL